jgi:hypothetical protein
MSKNNTLFLSPLTTSNKIVGLDRNTQKHFSNDAGKPFFDRSPIYQQLASFIGNQLARQPNFKTVNVLDQDGAGEYKPESQTLDIRSKSFPVKTFIHEGTHALDNREDPQKRSYQNEAINFLAKRLGNKPITNDKGNWYNSAQNIINNRTFKGKNYKFGEFKVDNNNLQNGIPYGEDFSGGILQEGQELLEGPNPNLSYSEIQNRRLHEQYR